MAAGLLIALVLGEILREIQKERKRLKAKIPGGEAQW
jgi:hypothetical protein